MNIHVWEILLYCVIVITFIKSRPDKGREQ